MSHKTAILNQAWAELIVEELVRCGVRRVCMASGSRSSPLAVAAARHARLECVVHCDERAAAFFALGLARASGIPAAWLTTSGTAAANGLPAIVEASNASIPLLAISADRPPELRDTGANQTIDQVKLFGNYTRWHFDMPCPDPGIHPRTVLTTVDQAMHRACHAPRGPVHINCMFREPLLPPPGSEPRPLAGIDDWQSSDEPFCRYLAGDTAMAEPQTEAIASLLGTCSKGLLVVGSLQSRDERDATARLAEKLGWPLLADVTSGLRLASPGGLERVAYYDQVLLSTSFAAAHQPDGVLHIGGPLVSKRLLEFLQASDPRHYVHVEPGPSRRDPNRQVRTRVQASICAFADAMSAGLNAPRNASWTEAWTSASDRAEAALCSFLGKQDGISEPGIAHAISSGLAAGHGLVLASSMPVRDMDMYGTQDGTCVDVAANRGASGIDGTIATACGFARGLDAPATAVIGDLACLHDLNSLAFMRSDGPPLTLVVVNNNGGGIFSFLPVADHEDVFEAHFGTPHGLHFEDAAGMFGLVYARPATMTAFLDRYRDAAASSRPTLIEVLTDREDNRRLHEELQASIQAAIDV